MGGANSESEDFVKSARRDVIDPFHIKMHFCIKCRCIGGIKISFTKKFFGGGENTYRVAEGHCEEEGGVARS